MIVVTGANGQLGRAVVEKLLHRLPADRIVASVREPAKASGLSERGVAVHAADFADPASLRRAFAGADQLLLVSADKLGEEAIALHRAAIEAARDAGVGRILYTSHMASRFSSPFAPADQHARTEADLAESGLSHTSLRHGFYAESCLHMVGDALKQGELRVPEDGPVGWTARADLAEADAAILAGSGRWDGVTPPLTAARAITMAELAALASEVGGRDVRHVVVRDQEWIEDKVAAGMPAFYARMLLGVFVAARRGDFAATDPLLHTLLGRPPATMRDAISAFGL